MTANSSPTGEPDGQGHGFQQDGGGFAVHRGAKEGAVAAEQGGERRFGFGEDLVGAAEGSARAG